MGRGGLTGQVIYHVKQGCGASWKKSDMGFARQERAEKEKTAKDKRGFWVRFGVAFVESVSEG